MNTDSMMSRQAGHSDIAMIVCTAVVSICILLFGVWMGVEGGKAGEIKVITAPLPYSEVVMHQIAECIAQGRAAAILQGHEFACLDVTTNAADKGTT